LDLIAEVYVELIIAIASAISGWLARHFGPPRNGG
jgi:hypothetical protein